MDRQIIKVLGIMVLMMNFSLNFIYAQEKEVKPETVNQQSVKQDTAKKEVPKEQTTIIKKEVSGIVSSLSTSFIAIETGVDAKRETVTEAAFNLEKDVTIVHKKSLKDIKVGDTIAVGYEETREKGNDGHEIRKNRVKTITFIKPASNKEMTVQEEAISPEEGTLP